MAQPKRRTSKSKIRHRVMSHKRKYPKPNECGECGMSTIPHRVCRSCGTYNGRRILTISGD